MGSKDGDLHQSSIMMNRVTYCILQATQEPALATHNHKGKLGQDLEKNYAEWIRTVEVRKGGIPGSM